MGQDSPSSPTHIYLLIHSVTVALLLESVSLTTSTATSASVVSLRLVYVKPRAQILWARLTYCLKKCLGQQHKHGAFSCATLEVAVIQDLTVSSFYAHCPMTQSPASLCKLLQPTAVCASFWGRVSTEEK